MPEEQETLETPTHEDKHSDVMEGIFDKLGVGGTPTPEEPKPAEPKEEPKEEPKVEPKEEPKPEEPVEPVIPDDLLKDEEPEEAPKGLDDKARDGWIKLRHRAEAAEKKLKELESRPQTPPEDLEALRKENERLETEVGKFDLTRTKTFKDTYDAPIAEKAKKVNTIITQLGVDPSTGYQALQLKLGDRIKFLGSKIESVEARQLLLNALSDIDDLAAKRVEAIENWKDQLEEIRKKETEIVSTELQKATSKTMDDAIKAVVSSVMESGEKKYRHVLLEKSSSNEDWNKTVDARIAKAKALATSGDTKAQAEALVKAALADDYLVMFMNERDRRIAVQRQLDKALGRKPKLGASEPTTKKREPGKPMNADDVAELMERELLAG